VVSDLPTLHYQLVNIVYRANNILVYTILSSKIHNIQIQCNAVGFQKDLESFSKKLNQNELANVVLLTPQQYTVCKPGVKHFCAYLESEQ
jgi:hypothetical protein